LELEKNNKEYDSNLSSEGETKKVSGDKYSSGYEILEERRLSKSEQQHEVFKNRLKWVFQAIGVLLLIALVGLFILGHFGGYDPDKPITLALCIAGLISTVISVVSLFTN